MKITAVRGLPLRCTCEPISDALSTSRARQALQSRLFMHNIRFSFVLSRQAVRLPCSQSLG